MASVKLICLDVILIFDLQMTIFQRIPAKILHLFLEFVQHTYILSSSKSKTFYKFENIWRPV